MKSFKPCIKKLQMEAYAFYTAHFKLCQDYPIALLRTKHLHSNVNHYHFQALCWR